MKPQSKPSNRLNLTILLIGLVISLIVFRLTAVQEELRSALLLALIGLSMAVAIFLNHQPSTEHPLKAVLIGIVCFEVAGALYFWSTAALVKAAVIVAVVWGFQNVQAKLTLPAWQPILLNWLFVTVIVFLVGLTASFQIL